MLLPNMYYNKWLCNVVNMPDSRYHTLLQHTATVVQDLTCDVANIPDVSIVVIPPAVMARYSR